MRTLSLRWQEDPNETTWVFTTETELWLAARMAAHRGLTVFISTYHGENYGERDSLKVFRPYLNAVHSN